MIVVTIDLWPRGDETKKRKLATVVIANAGGDARVANYNWAVSHQEGTVYAKAFEHPQELLDEPRLAWKKGSTKGFLRKLGAVKLLREVLNTARF